MAINTFSTLKSAVADWLDRDDIDAAIVTMIGLMETRLYSQLRVRNMESALSETISSGVITLPTDLIEFKAIYIDSSPIQAVEFKNLDWIHQQYPTRSSSGKPAYAALSSTTMVFGPYPDSAYNVAGIYYARPTALSASNETNFLTTTWPDLLFYGTLVHSALYLGQDARMAAWEGAYQDALTRIMRSERRESYPAGVALRSVAS
jgi:hypothetical protein